MTKKVLVIGDTHVGSDVALSPAEFVLDNNTIPANEVQMSLLDELYEMRDEVGVVDLLILGGDLVEGINFQGEGAGCITTNLNAQINNAVDVLSELRFRKVIGCKGTKYHVKNNPNADSLVIEGLGGVCTNEVSVNVNNTKIYVNHRTPVRMSNWESRPMSVAKDILFNELNSMDFGHHDIICKFHAHYYVGLDMGSSLGFVGPCWKGRDEFAKGAVNPFAFNPSIGYLYFDIDNDGFSWTKSVKHLKGDHLIKTYEMEDIPNRI